MNRSGIKWGYPHTSRDRAPHPKTWGQGEGTPSGMEGGATPPKKTRHLKQGLRRSSTRSDAYVIGDLGGVVPPPPKAGGEGVPLQAIEGLGKWGTPSGMEGGTTPPVLAAFLDPVPSRSDVNAATGVLEGVSGEGGYPPLLLRQGGWGYLHAG
jgi:hypothetical protein